MTTPDPRTQPVVSQDEIDRHDREFEEAHPDWDSEHGHGRQR